MSSTTKINDKATQAKTQGLSLAKEPEALNLRPLPNNRPISTNFTEDSDALMGYLD